MSAAADEPPPVSFRNGLMLPRPPSVVDAALADLDHRRLMFVRHLLETGRIGRDTQEER